MFCSSTLHFPSFASIPVPSATAAAATAIAFYIFLDRPLPGAPLGGLPVDSTNNTAPVRMAYGLLLSIARCVHQVKHASITYL